jgi:hypothetical protein
MQDPVGQGAAGAGPVAGRRDVAEVHDVAGVVERPELMPVAVDLGVGDVDAVDVRLLIRRELGRVGPVVLAIDEVNVVGSEDGELGRPECVEEVPRVGIPLGET